jgi:hypothetical protein
MRERREGVGVQEQGNNEPENKKKKKIKKNMGSAGVIYSEIQTLWYRASFGSKFRFFFAHLQNSMYRRSGANRRMVTEISSVYGVVQNQLFGGAAVDLTVKIT